MIRQNIHRGTNHMPKFTFIDLFAGIGGTRLGMERSGGQCIYTSEFDRFAVETYSANFNVSHGSHTIHGDITKIDANSIPDHDVLIGGFPCQPFSIAGVSKRNSMGRAHGFLDETKGTLFFDVVRILQAKRPKAFLLENVKNLTRHDKGHTIEVIMGALAEIGYEASYRVIDARYWVPQHRERTYIVGFAKPTAFNFASVKTPLIGPTLGEILHDPDGHNEPDGRFIDASGHVDSKYTLSDKLWNYLQGYKAKHQAAGNGFGYSLFGPNDTSRTLSARYGKDGSEILIRQDDRNPRRLTPRECARLMGFGEIVRGQEFRIPVSDAQAYKQFGNAAVSHVVAAIGQQMAPFL